MSDNSTAPNGAAHAAAADPGTPSPSEPKKARPQVRTDYPDCSPTAAFRGPVRPTLATAQPELAASPPPAAGAVTCGARPPLPPPPLGRVSVRLGDAEWLVTPFPGPEGLGGGRGWGLLRLGVARPDRPGRLHVREHADADRGCQADGFLGLACTCGEYAPAEPCVHLRGLVALGLVRPAPAWADLEPEFDDADLVLWALSELGEAFDDDDLDDPDPDPEPDAPAPRVPDAPGQRRLSLFEDDGHDDGGVGPYGREPVARAERGPAMKANPEGFGCLPNFVPDLPGYRPYYGAVLCAVTALANEDGECVAKRDQIALQSRTGLRNTSQAISWLIQSGVLTAVNDTDYASGRRLVPLWVRSGYRIKRIVMDAQEVDHV